MRTGRTMVLVLLILGGAVLAILIAGESSEQAFKTQPRNFDQEDVTRFLRERGTNVEDVSIISRDALGTKLFVMLLHDQTDQDRMITIASNGLSIVALPGTRCYPDSDGDFVAWFGREGTKAIHFKGGESLTLGRFDLFEVDPGGKYFIVGEKPNTTWLGRVASPSQKVRISEDVLGERVFADGRNIYVCGQSYKRKASDSYASQAVCLLLSDNGKQFQVQDRHTFEWASGIVDVDPFSRRLLLWDKWDWFNSVYVYDLQTKRRHRLGFAKRFQFFLVNDLLAGKGRPVAK